MNLRLVLVIPFIALATRAHPPAPPTPTATTSPVPTPAATTAPAPPPELAMFGLTPSRNMLSPEKNPPADWDTKTGKNIKWIADLGSKSFGNPVVSQGIIWLGTNNDSKKDPTYTPDAGVLMAFRESDGKFLWQRTSPKLPTGRINDFPDNGMTSSPIVEGDFLYYCTNRAELVCLDVSPLVKGTGVPRDVWFIDMINDLGVFPHSTWCVPFSSSSPLIWKDHVYILTANGVDETHKHIPSPDAPSLICVDKKSGLLEWSDNSPGPRILHSQWSSPALAIVNGRPLVIAAMGDAVVRAFDADTGKIIWTFDANPKNTLYPNTKNEILATPVIVDNKMYIAVGQDPLHGEGPGHIWCVDITKTGDISAELLANPDHPTVLLEVPSTNPDDAQLALAMSAKPGKPNPNSAVVWDFAVTPGVAKPRGKDRMNRSLSTVAVSSGLVFAPDLSGYLHCFDAATGKQYWCYDMEAALQGSPLVIDDKVFLASETGDVKIFAATKDLKVLAERILEENIEGAWDAAILYSTPVMANGTLYIMSRAKLFAIHEKK